MTDRSSYEIKNNTLIFETANQKTVVKYPCPVHTVVEIGRNLVVRLEVMRDDITPDRNIYCLDRNGRQIWQIQDPQELEPDHKLDYRRVFHGLVLTPEKTLTAFDKYTRYVIDPETGKILSQRFSK